MLGLEYILLFGLSENKLELIDGRTRCRLPFATRQDAEMHFLAWAETLARWQGLSAAPPVQRAEHRWEATIADFRLILEMRVITCEVPMSGNAVFESQHRFWQLSRWPVGSKARFSQHYELWTKLYFFLDVFGEHEQGGQASGKVDVVMSDATMAEPDVFYYVPERTDCLVDRNYFVGPPDLAVEIVAPATEVWDRGRRRDAYAKAGVPYFWLVAPETDSLLAYELREGSYQQTVAFHVGESFRHPLFPGKSLNVAEMFHFKQHYDLPAREDMETEPEFVATPDEVVGLQNLLLAGHPDRRYEILDGFAPCVAAFRDETVARIRFEQFAREIAQWEGVSLNTGGLQEHPNEFSAGRFTLSLDGPRVALDVAASAAVYRQMLEVYHNVRVWREWHEAVDS